mgnify:CR=1 FL=1
MTSLIQLHCEALAQALLAHKACMATAESCTGGMIAASCTNLSGSSAWFERGFVTYANEAKTEMLGVPATLIAQHGAVSEEVAKAMALGALAHSKANFSVAVTGVAGPTGGSPEKPVVQSGLHGPLEILRNASAFAKFFRATGKLFERPPLRWPWRTWSRW